VIPAALLFMVCVQSSTPPPQSAPVEKIAEMEAATKAIATEEAAMNDLLFDLYALTGEERELVRRG